VHSTQQAREWRPEHGAFRYVCSENCVEFVWKSKNRSRIHWAFCSIRRLVVGEKGRSRIKNSSLLELQPDAAEVIGTEPHTPPDKRRERRRSGPLSLFS
jgi:hypothetical protein